MSRGGRILRPLAWALAGVFGLVFVGATLLNADLVFRSRRVLGGGALRDRWRGEPARYHVVVVLPDSDDSFFRGLLDGIGQGAERADAAVQVFRYPLDAPSEAAPFVEIALRAKVDGLIQYTPREDRVAERAAQAARSGVVYIPVGTDAPVGAPPAFIGTSAFRQGLAGGRQICARLGRKARIGVILPATGSGPAAAEPLYRGLAAAVRECPRAAIVAVGRARPGVLSGEDTAAGMLRAGTPPNALLCSSLADTLGAAQVVVDRNLVGRIFIVGADENPAVRRYVAKGVIGATVVRDSAWIGAEAMRAFVQRRESGGRRERGADLVVRGPGEAAP